MRNRLDALQLVVPEFRNTLRAGKTTSHAYDGNAFSSMIGRLLVVHVGLPTRRSRCRAKAARCLFARCWESENEDPVVPPRCIASDCGVVNSNNAVIGIC